MSFHDTLVGADIHVIHAYTYADAATRLAATGFVSADVGKIAKQSDNSTYWILKATTPAWSGPLGVGGGGGGGGDWRVGAGDGSAQSPSEDIEFFSKVLLFSKGDAGSQAAYRSFIVPSSYVPGVQILLGMGIYSPSAANTILLLGQSTLVRPGTDAENSTTNQRTSTNTALTNTVANMLRTVLLDITNTSGMINGVAVSPGDEIKVSIYRGTDTDTADMRVKPDNTDPRFF